MFLTSFIALVLVALGRVGLCQDPTPSIQTTDTQDEAESTLNIFHHPDHARYLVSGQANIVFQAHGPFHSPYEDTNSCFFPLRRSIVPALLDFRKGCLTQPLYRCHISVHAGGCPLKTGPYGRSPFVTSTARQCA